MMQFSNIFLTRTHEWVNELDGNSIAMFTAVVTRAISEASFRPRKWERRERRNSIEALSAIHWIFKSGSGFEVYCKLAGIDPEILRATLLGKAGIQRTGNRDVFYSTINARSLRWRKRVYDRYQRAEAEELERVELGGLPALGVEPDYEIHERVRDWERYWSRYGSDSESRRRPT